MGVYIKGVTVKELMKVLICSTEFMPDDFEIVQVHDVGDMVSRRYLLTEYDRQHEGPPGGARKIIEEAPSIEPEIILCADCIHWTRTYGDDRWSLGDCNFFEKKLVMCKGYCAWAQRRCDE